MSPAEAALHAQPPQLYMQLRGVAASRGETWQPATLDEARRCVVDLATGDAAVREMLAEEALRWSPRR